MDKNKAKWQALETKKLRIRKRVAGTAERPRLSIYRSEQHIYGQIIDDLKGHTLIAVSTISPDIKDRVKDLKPIDAAKVIGEALAEKAVAAGVSKVVFDRNGRQYGGRLQALADAARAKGLQF
jgi:large subunit ribosomal protein L18